MAQPIAQNKLKGYGKSVALCTKNNESTQYPYNYIVDPTTVAGTQVEKTTNNRNSEISRKRKNPVDL